MYTEYSPNLTDRAVTLVTKELIELIIDSRYAGIPDVSRVSCSVSRERSSSCTLRFRQTARTKRQASRESIDAIVARESGAA
jgi:hypothetical protein